MVLKHCFFPEKLYVLASLDIPHDGTVFRIRNFAARSAGRS